jgi:hypothetical protein
MADMFGIQFYPTPEWLVDKMLDKVDFSNVTSILEPSAGKGDIVEGIWKHDIRKKTYYELKFCNTKNKLCREIFLNLNELNEYFLKEFRLDASKMTINEINNWLIDNTAEKDDYMIIYHQPNKNEYFKCEIECVEIDSNLCAILKDKGYFTVNQDFLKYNTLKRYDCILMNPPFAQGEYHLLKALKLIENGGQCACILNAETLKNPYTNWRQELLNILNQYNADIEYVNSAFSHAENKTDVEIALVYINIPQKTADENLVKNLVTGENFDREYDEFDENQLATSDIIDNLVKQYELEARLGTKLIDDFYSMQAYIPKVKDRNDVSMLNLSIIGCIDEQNSDRKINPVNQYIRGLRDKYWSLLFMSNEMGKLLTESARRNYMNQLIKFRDYDFTFLNIKQLQIDMMTNLNQNIDEAILSQFDNFTYKYSLDKETNVHYFNGWRTNDAFMIRSKVIIPMYGLYTKYGSWSIYECKDYLNELEKIFVYLDGGRTEGGSVNEILDYNVARDYNGGRIKFKYFDIELKKKGTVHIWFTNEDLLKKFNIFGCQKHGWLPDCYGKKAYKNMTKEEQSVIDEFEGKTEYEKVFADPNKFISGGQMLQLM